MIESIDPDLIINLRDDLLNQLQTVSLDLTELVDLTDLVFFNMFRSTDLRRRTSHS